MMMVDNQNNLFCWGNNNKGQLGIGHNRNLNVPVINDNAPKNIKIKQIKAKGDSNLLLSHCGKTYYWPIDKGNGEIISRPMELIFPFKTLISSVNSGHNFSILLSTSGIVFSLGSDNSEGQLGHGDIQPRISPTLIECLKNAG